MMEVLPSLTERLCCSLLPALFEQFFLLFSAFSPSLVPFCFSFHFFPHQIMYLRVCARERVWRDRSGSNVIFSITVFGFDFGHRATHQEDSLANIPAQLSFSFRFCFFFLFLMRHRKVGGVPAQLNQSTWNYVLFCVSPFRPTSDSNRMQAVEKRTWRDDNDAARKKSHISFGNNSNGRKRRAEASLDWHSTLA